MLAKAWIGGQSGDIQCTWTSEGKNEKQLSNSRYKFNSGTGSGILFFDEFKRKRNLCYTTSYIKTQNEEENRS